MMSPESMAALSGAVPVGLSSPISPRKSNVPTRHHVVKQSAAGTKLAPKIANVNPPAHADRTRAKNVPINGIATQRAIARGGGPSNY